MNLPACARLPNSRPNCDVFTTGPDGPPRLSHAHIRDVRIELRASFHTARERGLLDIDAGGASTARVERRPSLAMLHQVIEEFETGRAHTKDTLRAVTDRAAVALPRRALAGSVAGKAAAALTLAALVLLVPRALGPADNGGLAVSLAMATAIGGPAPFARVPAPLDGGARRDVALALVLRIGAGAALAPLRGFANQLAASRERPGAVLARAAMGAAAFAAPRART